MMALRALDGRAGAAVITSVMSRMPIQEEEDQPIEDQPIQDQRWRKQQ
jgi:hypothetical protein